MQQQAQPSRVVRSYRHPLRHETTRLRFNLERGMVSRPERAGLDVGPHVFCHGSDLETCRAVWRRAEAALLAEGFEVTGTESR